MCINGRYVGFQVIKCVSNVFYMNEGNEKLALKNCADDIEEAYVSKANRTIKLRGNVLFAIGHGSVLLGSLKLYLFLYLNRLLHLLALNRCNSGDNRAA